MGRPRSTPEGRPVIVSVRLTAAEARDLDVRRRSLSRSAYLRRLLKPDALLVEGQRVGHAYTQVPISSREDPWPGE